MIVKEVSPPETGVWEARHCPRGLKLLSEQWGAQHRDERSDRGLEDNHQSSFLHGVRASHIGSDEKVEAEQNPPLKPIGSIDDVLTKFNRNTGGGGA